MMLGAAARMISTCSSAATVRNCIQYVRWYRGPKRSLQSMASPPLYSMLHTSDGASAVQNMMCETLFSIRPGALRTPKPNRAPMHSCSARSRWAMLIVTM
jgi:hypothetical protein